MEQKKNMIAAAVVLIAIAAAAYLSMGKAEEKAAAPAAETGSQSAADSSISDSYSDSEEEDAKDSESVDSGDFAILEKLVDAYPNTDFSSQQDVSFEWMTASGSSPLEMEGKSIEASGIAGRIDFDNFFEKAGFKEDLDNAADGTTNGQQGFSDGSAVCLYEYASKGESEETDEESSPIYNIKISCAKALRR